MIAHNLQNKDQKSQFTQNQYVKLCSSPNKNDALFVLEMYLRFASERYSL